MATPHLVGINHVALEVGDLDEALRFWSALFEIKVEREPEYRMAFIEIGDQFIALSEGSGPRTGSPQHFGLVVDDKQAVRARLTELGIDVTPGRRLNFRDPWGNLIQVVEYSQIQFTKEARILSGMGLGDLGKTPEAEAELEAKGLH